MLNVLPDWQYFVDNKTSYDSRCLIIMLTQTSLPLGVYKSFMDDMQVLVITLVVGESSWISKTVRPYLLCCQGDLLVVQRTDESYLD